MCESIQAFKMAVKLLWGLSQCIHMYMCVYMYVQCIYVHVHVSLFAGDEEKDAALSPLFFLLGAYNLQMHLPSAGCQANLVRVSSSTN